MSTQSLFEQQNKVNYEARVEYGPIKLANTHSFTEKNAIKFGI